MLLSCPNLDVCIRMTCLPSIGIDQICTRSAPSTTVKWANVPAALESPVQRHQVNRTCVPRRIRAERNTKACSTHHNHNLACPMSACLVTALTKKHMHLHCTIWFVDEVMRTQVEHMCTAMPAACRVHCLQKSMSLPTAVMTFLICMCRKHTADGSESAQLTDRAAHGNMPRCSPEDAQNKR
jgi:hypothetical protein